MMKLTIHFPHDDAAIADLMAVAHEIMMQPQSERTVAGAFDARAFDEIDWVLGPAHDTVLESPDGSATHVAWLFDSYPAMGYSESWWRTEDGTYFSIAG